MLKFFKMKIVFINEENSEHVLIKKKFYFKKELFAVLIWLYVVLFSFLSS